MYHPTTVLVWNYHKRMLSLASVFFCFESLIYNRYMRPGEPWQRRGFLDTVYPFPTLNQLAQL